MSAKARAFQQACRARLLVEESGRPIRPVQRTTVIRPYATQSSLGGSNSSGKPPRRAITVTSDDGRYAWSELSRGEKAARTTQQSFNFVFVTAGALATVAVIYLLYTELFASDSKTRQFNRAVDRVKADPRCREILGPSNEIVAYGEPTSNKWARARPLAHSVDADKHGTTQFKMHFNVEGPNAKGIVSVHMTKRQDQDELEYKLLSLTVPGHPTVYLENADAKPASSVRKMFGVKWS